MIVQRLALATLRAGGTFHRVLADVTLIMMCAHPKPAPSSPSLADIGAA